MIHIAIIATNKYFPLGVRFIKKFDKHTDVKPRYHFFSNISPNEYLPDHIDCSFYHTEHESWRDATNSKFENIINIDASNQDYIYYFDADTNITKDFSVEWFLGDSVGGEHFGNNGFLSGNTGYDRNPASKAFVPEDSELDPVYYYGAFFGGRANFVKYFCETLMDWQQKDRLIPYEPGVNDESYINKFFHYTPPIKTVPSAEFKFNVSDKGGLDNTRTVEDLPAEIMLKLREYKDLNIEILNGEVKLYQD